MSNPNTDTILREANDLLETAQKEVLREINSQERGILKFFMKKKNNSLKQAQSAISKAINQMKTFAKDESSVVNKLQNHINEKTTVIKKLEESFSQSQKESSELRDKMKFFETELERLQQVAVPVEKPIVPTVQNHLKLEEEFKDRVKELEEANKDLQTRFSASRQDLEKSQQLSVELSSRIKRIKAEITNS